MNGEWMKVGVSDQGRMDEWMKVGVGDQG